MGSVVSAGRGEETEGWKPSAREEKTEGKMPSARGDCVVWACRGGGKTLLGALVSLLECVWMEGCSVRILGGSEEQSRRMYEYLTRWLKEGYSAELEGAVTRTGCRFGNGSAVQVLAQSQASVRGHHVQRLRCDEVELFDPEVWEAAQLITQSRGEVVGRLEALSTMHRPGGLMSRLVRAEGMRVFQWCLLEVLERCEGRECSQCGLWEDCRGSAKESEGYYRIDDALAQKRRVSEATWEAEMLCRRPSEKEMVFGEFDRARHVRSVAWDGDLPTFWAIDFGYSNPLVCLLIQTDDERVWVLDEHVKARTTLAEHVRQLRARWPMAVLEVYCDPAGRQRREITGTSPVTELAALGVRARCRRSAVLEGIGLVRDFLAPADGSTRLFVDPKCQHLIAALAGLRYGRLGNGAYSEAPEKDGVHDHLVDALRYFFVNRFPRRVGVSEVGY